MENDRNLFSWNLYSAYASLETRAFFGLLTHNFMKKNSMVASNYLNLATGFLSRQTTVELIM